MGNRPRPLGYSGGGAGNGGGLATTSLEFEFCLQFPCGFPSTELSDFHQSADVFPVDASNTKKKGLN